MSEYTTFLSACLPLRRYVLDKECGTNGQLQ